LIFGARSGDSTVAQALLQVRTGTLSVRTWEESIMTYHDILERGAYLLIGILIVLLIDAVRTCQYPFLWCTL
jgi:hypothetical protein